MQCGPEVLPFTDTIPVSLNGNCCSSQGTTPGTSETPVIAVDRQELPSASGSLPCQMEDGDYNFEDWIMLKKKLPQFFFI